MKGFFSSPSVVNNTPTSLVPKCGACGLYKQCQSPKMPMFGDGRKSILIVGEAPGKQEDDQGIPFIGESGSILKRQLKELGIQIDRDCWRSNALICRPPKNRTPTSKEIGYCRPNITNLIRQLKPRVILLLGRSAMHSVIGQEWQKDLGTAERWIGWQIPSRKFQAWLCPTWHPAYLARMNEKVLWSLWKQHLANTVAISARPEFENFADQVELIYNPEQAARILRKMIAKGGTVAFDYETNMLKPDHPEAEIICCGVCYEGKKTIAYPWLGAAIPATGELLRSPQKKIGANNKFEDRWTRAIFGHRVRNFVWDTMLAAHVLDNRKSITSVKFQAYIRFGLAAYDESITNYLKAESSNVKNRIQAADPYQLLLYCGMDALLEYQIAMQQQQELGIEV